MSFKNSSLEYIKNIVTIKQYQEIMRGGNQKELLEIKDIAHQIKNSTKAGKNNAKSKWQTKGCGQRQEGVGRGGAQSFVKFQHTNKYVTKKENWEK